MLAAILLCAAFAAEPAQPPDPKPPADPNFHAAAVVVDAHCDVTEAMFYDGYDLLARHRERHVDLPRLREGGIDAEFFSVFVHPESVDLTRFFPTAMQQIELLQKTARRSGGTLRMARNAEEVRENAASGVTSMLIGVEGAHMLLPGTEDEQLAHLKAFADRGVRYLTLSWSSSSPIGGSTAEDAKTGLTPFGKRVLAEMARLGIVVDLSHGSEALFWDVIGEVKRPVLLSHSAARALSNHPRNASDAMLQAVARNGGAACVDFSRTFLDDRFRRATQALLQETKGMRTAAKIELYKRSSLPEVPLSTLADHIEHVARLAGSDHVCLGSDFDNAPMMPVGLEDASRFPALTATLRARGWSAGDLRKLLGENLLRVLAASER